MLIRNLNVAIASSDIYIAAPRGDHQRCLTRDEDVHVGNHFMSASAFCVGVQRNIAIADRDLRFGAGVVFIGILLPVGANSLADYNLDLVVVRDVHIDRAVIVHHAEAAARWKRLCQLVVIVVRVSEQRKVAVVDVDLIADGLPVHACGLRSDQPGHDQDNQQEHASGTDPGRPRAFALGLLIVEQLDDAPDDEQQRPKTREQVTQAVPMQNAHRLQQEHNSQDDEHNRAGHRPASSWSYNRARHF